MLSGLKFIPRDHIDEEKDGKSVVSRKDTRKSRGGKEKRGRKKKHSHYSSSDDEDVEKIKSGSRKKKKWYDSNEDMSSSTDEGGSQSDLERDQKRHGSWKEEKKKHGDGSDNKHRSRSKKKAKGRRGDYSPEYNSLSSSEDGRSSEDMGHQHERMNRSKDRKECGTNSDNIIGSKQNSNNILREEVGLAWMLRPKNNLDEISNKSSLIEPEEESSLEEIMKDNTRELNPYFKSNGTGYPEESDEMKAGKKQYLSTTIIGDGGASWRLKALKRAEEQATREGRNLQEVVEERWGSMGHLAASVASRDVAPTHAHLHAIKNRRKELVKEQKYVDEEINETEKEREKDVHTPHPKKKMPKVHDSLSWGKRGSKKMSAEDSALVSAAMSNMNKFSNDGNFMAKFMSKEEKHVDRSIPSNFVARAESTSVDFASRASKEDARTPPMGSNQLAAKVLQLRMKGKHDEAEKLMHESSTRTVEDNVWDETRNFKKCLIMMFAKQEKDVVLFETVMGLAQQRRHCMVECIPLARDIAKRAPLYFKKAIDEAEEEWSQHNAKKLIDTSEKGLRGSIPKNFPYFHVEFGLDRGFVHVIDDEKEFKSNFGHNIIRGMLRLPAEDMHRRWRHESVDVQKDAVASFIRDWEPFDWTKQL